MTTLECRNTEEQLQTPETVLAMTAELSDPSSDWHQRFYDAEKGVKATPVWQLPEQAYGHTVLVKDETSHVVTVGGRQYDAGSFKRRGAWAAAVAPTALGTVEPDVLVAASAGNHAYGVALAAALLGKRAEIYCKDSVSPVKKANNERVGAVVFDQSDTIEDAIFAASVSEGLGADGLVRRNIKPFDQAEVIAGQATMVAEWLSSLEAAQRDDEIDVFTDDITVIVPVGGGGLIGGWAAGLAVAQQQGRIGNNFRLVGAQMERCDAMNRALQCGDSYDGSVTVRADELNGMNDGTAVRQPGELTFSIAQKYVDEMVVLSPAEVGVAMRQLSSELGKDVEPAGALAYAAANKLAAERPHNGANRSFMTCVASGANVSQATKRYFEDQIELQTARQRFAAQSAAYLRHNTAFRRLMAGRVGVGRSTSATAVGASPTGAYRTNPHKERAEYLATRPHARG